ncbi:MAG: PilZ domain-containing protein, partial [Bdellovibrionia bacterium]
MSRSPRYVIRTGEQQVLRFSRGGSKKKIAKTRILNLSDSGMAFSVDGRAIPHIGEIIKVEFEVGNRVTRYGRVVRLESPSDIDTNYNDIEVAIEFLTEKAAGDEGLVVPRGCEDRNPLPLVEVGRDTHDAALERGDAGDVRVRPE